MALARSTIEWSRWTFGDEDFGFLRIDFLGFSCDMKVDGDGELVRFVAGGDFRSPDWGLEWHSCAVGDMVC